MLSMTTISGSPGEPDELENCIERIAGGDRAALGRLYELTGAAVYGFALSILKSRHDAEDVQQDVYLQIWKGARRYEAKGRPRAWIFEITKNLALMRMREQKRTVPTELEDWQDMWADVPAVDHEDRMMLAALLRLLTEEERQIVVLHAVSGMKHREIAALLKMNLSTVLSKYNRALKKLREAAKGETR